MLLRGIVTQLTLALRMVAVLNAFNGAYNLSKRRYFTDI